LPARFWSRSRPPDAPGSRGRRGGERDAAEVALPFVVDGDTSSSRTATESGSYRSTPPKAGECYGLKADASCAGWYDPPQQFRRTPRKRSQAHAGLTRARERAVGHSNAGNPEASRVPQRVPCAASSPIRTLRLHRARLRSARSADRARRRHGSRGGTGPPARLVGSMALDDLDGRRIYEEERPGNFHPTGRVWAERNAVRRRRSRSIGTPLEHFAGALWTSVDFHGPTVPAPPCHLQGSCRMRELDALNS